MVEAGGIVLVHGGMHGGWCWDRVAPLLDRPALAVDMPGRPGGVRPDASGLFTLSDYATSAIDQIDAAGFDEVVLVAHSFGGVSIPLVAERLGSRVRHLVFVAAQVARAGENVMSALPQPLRGIVQGQMNRRATTPGATLGIPGWAARHYLCHGLSAEDTRTVLARICPEPLGPLAEKVSTAQPAQPRTYLGFRSDRTLSPRAQRKFADTLEAPWITVEGGHNGMLSNAAGVARVINWISREAFA